MTKIPPQLWQQDFLIQGGKQLNLSTLGAQYCVLYFYPKDNTPGCSSEAQDFRDLQQEFLQNHTRIIGVSRDNVKSHERFSDKYALEFPLIADQEEQLCQAFTVIKPKNMFGKLVKGIERSTFILNNQGDIIKEWRKVKVTGHAQEVLQYIVTL